MEQWQIEEMRKCANSFEYFCENYVKILHPARGLVPFRLYDYQKRVIRAFTDNLYSIVSKFRQAGLTTVAVIWGMWRCMFDLDQRVLILSKSDREAIGVGKIVQLVKDNLPEWMNPVMRNDNDHEKEFVESNGVMWFYTCEAARSKAITFLIIDEAAHIKGMHEHWKGIYPTLAGGGSCAVISTVNGVGNWYEETFMRAKDKRNQFYVIELDYKEHPDYCNPEWEKKTRANLGEKGWLQEIMRQFLGSGDTFVPTQTLQDIDKKTREPIRKLFPEWDTTPSETFEEKDLPNTYYEPGAMWVWEEPMDGQEYIISADCATGHGGELDANVFHVINLITFEQVAEFQSNICNSFQFAQVLAQAGVYYKECMIVVENDTGPGMAVLEWLLHKLRYPNIYFSNSSGKGRDKPGVTLGRTNRQVFLETMRSCLTNGLIGINSARCVRELYTFIVDAQTGKPKASPKKHDDLVMALAIGLYVTDVMNRDMPIGVADGAKDYIGEAIKGQSMEQIRLALEEGIDDDLFMLAEEYEDLLPRSMIPEHYRRRQNEDLLKTFAW